MLLQPKRRKFKKERKRNITVHKGPQCANLQLQPLKGGLKYANQGLRAHEGGRLTARQIEASRRTITRALQRKGKLQLRAFPDTPITSKPTGTRMGKGKGNISHWVAVLKPGQIIFEILGVSQDTAFRALQKAANKIPLRTGPISRHQPLHPRLQ